jgi:hypothetical protein
MASLIDNMDLIQGDSSTIFKFGESTGKVLDDNWEASFVIVETDVNTPIISRTLSKDNEKLNFIFQILPTDSEILEVGKKYQVAVEIKNETLNFNVEVAQFKLKILPQYVLN